MHAPLTDNEKQVQESNGQEETVISALQYHQLGPEGEAGGGRLCFLDRTEFVLLTAYKLGPICC